MQGLRPHTHRTYHVLQADTVSVEFPSPDVGVTMVIPKEGESEIAHQARANLSNKVSASHTRAILPRLPDAGAWLIPI